MSCSKITKLFHNFFTTSLRGKLWVSFFFTVYLSQFRTAHLLVCVSFFFFISHSPNDLVFAAANFSSFFRVSHTLKSFLNKWESWTSRLFEQAHVLDHTAHVLRMVQHTTYHYFICMYIYIYIYIYIWWVLHMYNCNQVKLVIHLHIWDHNIFQPSASQTKWSFTKPISPLFKNTCNFFFFLGLF